MKKFAILSLGVLVAFGVAFVAPQIIDSHVVHAAFFKCSKCGRGTSGNPNAMNPNCPKGGYHSWYRAG